MAPTTTQENRTQAALRALTDRLQYVEEQLAARGNPGNPGTRGFTGQDGVELKEHIESRLRAIDEFYAMRVANMEQATRTALASLDKRLEGMNEFREALKDATARLPTRNELDAKFERVSSELSELQKFKNTMEGKASQSSVNIFMLLSVLSVLMAAAGLLLRFTAGG
jgi:hypothetical protein